MCIAARIFSPTRGNRVSGMAKRPARAKGPPAVGTAEMIVDITTTGATLAANGLKVLDDGVILRSQANLVASKDADWSADARETARVILDHIAARADRKSVV